MPAEPRAEPSLALATVYYIFTKLTNLPCVSFTFKGVTIATENLEVRDAVKSSNKQRLDVIVFLRSS